MAILCGTDFSEAAAHAVTAAAALARCTQQPLAIVHCLEVPRHELYEEARRASEARLQAEVERVRAGDLSVQARVLEGEPAAALIEGAQLLGASWIMVGPRGQSHAHTGIGSRAESLAAQAHVPVLVVRDAAPFVAWAERAQPLRVLVGVDESLPTGAALKLVDALRAVGPCEVSALHLYWPPQQFERFGFGYGRDFLEVDPEIRKQLEASLAAQWGPLPIEVAPRIGNFGDGLARAAQRDGAHLIVVGTHGRDTLARIWEGSVSRGVLRQAETNVACAPLPEAAPSSNVRPLRNVLVATDLSRTGNAAIALAYGAVASGGTVYIIHVVERAPTNLLEPTDIFALERSDTPSELRDSIHERLRALVPQRHQGAPCSSVVYVLESNDPARAIAQAAERLHADAICVGTRGRGGLAQALMGSVAQGVIKHSQRPVLLSRASR